MGLRFTCPRRAVAAAETDGTADWIIVGETPTVSPVVVVSAARLRWNQAIRKVIIERKTYRILAKLFARLGTYLQDSRRRNARNARTRQLVASAWSSIGRYLNCRKALYQKHGTQRPRAAR